MNSIRSHWPALLMFVIVFFIMIRDTIRYLNRPSIAVISDNKPDYWIAPSLFSDDAEGFDRRELVYGEKLIANTSKYLGPMGEVSQVTNGMNCQNCHLDAGTKPFGNNYSAVFSTYPKLRERSGTIETIYKRVNDCFERSLNGTALDSNSREMKAIYQYLKWLGKDVKKGEKPKGSGIRELPYLTRAADTGKGKQVFISKCQTCHGPNGEGLKNIDGNGYVYPPLWGEHSFSTGAGLYRISRLAGYVHDNMPFEQSSHQSPLLTVEECWDVAAFVNSQPRPQKDLSRDWPDISKKPVDHPFGPYADGFNEHQHKYGPFQPILEARKNITAATASGNKSIAPKLK
ncbi:MAG TPA: c-type cytochrome [Chitinophagaceae bacterium]